MAFTFGFYNSVNGDRKYDAVQVGQIFDGIIKDGIYETYKKAMIVRESSRDNEVIIQPGRAWFNHTWSYNDADLPFGMPGPEAVLHRIDALVLAVDLANHERRNYYTWVKGEPSNSPQRPGLLHNATYHQYPLCYITRYAGQNHIYQRDITNMVGSSECPFVTGVIEGLNIDDLVLQWTDQYNNYITSKQAYFNAWMAGEQRTFTDWRSSQQTAFSNWKNSEQQKFFAWIENVENHFQTSFYNWFDHLQNELSSNQAANLQRQIDAISYIYAIEPVLYLPSTAASVSGNRLILIKHN